MTTKVESIDSKDPAETFPVTMSFRKALGAEETIATVVNVTASVIGGIDATPQNIVSGLASISSDSKAVSQWLTAGVHGVTYKLKIRITTSTGRTLVGAALVPVRTR